MFDKLQLEITGTSKMSIPDMEVNKIAIFCGPNEQEEQIKLSIKPLKYRAMNLILSTDLCRRT